MGSRYKEDKPFGFYDPEQDREGQKQSPRNRSAPVSPRNRSAPVSPRAQPSGQAYPPTSPRQQPFGHYDPELDGEKGIQGSSYGPELSASPSGLHSKSTGRGAPPYMNPDSSTLSGSNGYGRDASEPGYGGRGGPQPGYPGRGAPEPGYGGRGAPGPGYGGRGAPEPGYGGIGGPNGDYSGRGAPDPGYAGRGASEPGYGGRGAPDPGYGGRGAPDAGYGGRGAPEPGYVGRGASDHGFGGRGAPEPGYGGRGAPVRPYPPPPNQNFEVAPGRGRGGEPGYPGPGRPAQMDDDLGRGRGRGSSGVPIGAGRYVYGGLQQPDRATFEEDYEIPPAPISSEYAHQVYASVFSDPVYGGAGRLNARAGYAEEPEDLQQLHHKQDVLRHPDQF